MDQSIVESWKRGGYDRAKLMKDFVEKCFVPAASFEENKAGSPKKSPLFTNIDPTIFKGEGFGNAC